MPAGTFPGGEVFLRVEGYHLELLWRSCWKTCFHWKKVLEEIVYPLWFVISECESKKLNMIHSLCLFCYESWVYQAVPYVFGIITFRRVCHLRGRYLSWLGKLRVQSWNLGIFVSRRNKKKFSKQRIWFKRVVCFVWRMKLIGGHVS